MNENEEPDNEMSFNASQAADMSAATRMKYVLDTMYSVGDYERYRGILIFDHHQWVKRVFF